MPILGLASAAAVVLDAGGNGTASAGPAIPGEVWTPAAVSVKCSSHAAEALCTIYAGGGISGATFVDGTTWGSSGDSTTNLAGNLYPGQQIYAVWAGGDPGTTASLSVTGTRSVP